MRSATALRLKVLRIVSQALFAAAFVLTYLVSLDPFAHVDNYFLESDPLVFLTHLRVQPLAFGLMIALLAAAALAGRVFCGWICPLGGLIDLLDLAASPLRRLARRALRRRRPAGRPAGRPVPLLTDLPPSVFLLGLLVPSLFLAPPVLQFLHPNVWAVRIISLVPMGLAFAGLLAVAALVNRRLWCRFVCPLGALYGLLGRVAPLRLRIAGCSRCGRCDGCPMGAADSASRRVLGHQCILCFDYEHRCPVEGFRFGRAGAPPQAARRAAPAQSAQLAQSADPPQPGRREFLRRSAVLAAGAVVAGAVGFPRRASATSLLRPPGVVDEEQFIERCLRCLQCVQSCPNEIIKITGPQAGLANLMTPHLEFGEYGCDYLCQVCQTVCPNFAIPLQTLAEKQATPIGKAKISESDCVVFRDGINCLVCEEVCPVPGKAIRIREGTVLKDGRPEVLRYPVMDDAKCIGCGICEAGCPATPIAIVVRKG